MADPRSPRHGRIDLGAVGSLQKAASAHHLSLPGLTGQSSIPRTIDVAETAPDLVRRVRGAQ
jgi:hypothetical protein